MGEQVSHLPKTLKLQRFFYSPCSSYSPSLFSLLSDSLSLSFILFFALLDFLFLCFFLLCFFFFFDFFIFFPESSICAKMATDFNWEALLKLRLKSWTCNSLATISNCKLDYSTEAIAVILESRTIEIANIKARTEMRIFIFSSKN